jgi:hypothetical protein
MDEELKEKTKRTAARLFGTLKGRRVDGVE